MWCRFDARPRPPRRRCRRAAACDPQRGSLRRTRSAGLDRVRPALECGHEALAPDGADRPDRVRGREPLVAATRLRRDREEPNPSPELRRQRVPTDHLRELRHEIPPINGCPRDPHAGVEGFAPCGRTAPAHADPPVGRADSTRGVIRRPRRCRRSAGGRHEADGRPAERLGLADREWHPQAVPFLDLRSVVVADGEKGLLSIAFAPDYASSGLVYAYYNNRDGNIRLDRVPPLGCGSRLVDRRGGASCSRSRSRPPTTTAG